MLAKINTASATALFVATVWCCFALLVGSTVAQGNESPDSGSASMTDNVLSWARIAQAIATAIALALVGSSLGDEVSSSGISSPTSPFRTM